MTEVIKQFNEMKLNEQITVLGTLNSIYNSKDWRRVLEMGNPLIKIGSENNKGYIRIQPESADIMELLINNYIMK